ncbi:hypothetical protein LCGC14_0735970 [marine sediment metagenome]|uniref:Uncharacterized protein n=1 Tax=marine sediment metagenome TaxID=412755 RepID=A0A0F9Q846_9ZZZZ
MTSVATFTERDLGFELARRSFLHFLDYVWILEPPPGRGTILLEKWPHIVEAAEALTMHRLIVWLKARQIGASWLTATWDLWNALFSENARILLFSQGEDEAQDKLSKCKFVYEHLPEQLRTPLTTDNKGTLIFGNGSNISAWPSTTKAGRSATGTIVDMDEADFHEYFADNFNAVKPILDDNGGQLLLTSTSNAESMVSVFKDLFRGAPGNGFHPIFYAWDVRPNRSEDWYEERQQEYTDTYKFFKEYPSSAEVALAPPEELSAFDHSALDIMMEDVKPPLEVIGYANIYRKYIPGRKYAAGTDTSHGTGGDYGVTAIIDVATLAVVADIMSNTLLPEELAYESYKLLESYSFPIWGIEDNDWGVVTVNKARDLGYPRLYKRDDTHLGWKTTTRSKPILWSELIDATNARAMVIFSRDGLRQYYNVQRDPKTGRIVAALHDDYPMAVGLALQVKDLATASTPYTKANPWDQRKSRAVYKWS